MPVRVRVIHYDKLDYPLCKSLSIAPELTRTKLDVTCKRCLKQLGLSGGFTLGTVNEKGELNERREQNS